ncbi:hypothetical protein HXX76_016090 [Chlamydomonas incerta]|uniref:Plastocyanin-like domain-containing protein n=1 Tax=Chlamydomonas incerta TaxID=51695 RepID=A0A835VNY7_CHLIN|nr:hypothetical protein HXX76_016090 [Chlamydomonas incerta]|eukprot:KAG2422365.1 hypothetical protein HXX76_016090 [Chlamydomonas incerta]
MSHSCARPAPAAAASGRRAPLMRALSTALVVLLLMAVSVPFAAAAAAKTASSGPRRALFSAAPSAQQQAAAPQPQRRRLAAAGAYPAVSIPIRPGSLPRIPCVSVSSGGYANVTLEPVTVKVTLDAATSLNFTTPRFTVKGGTPMTAMDGFLQSLSSLQQTLLASGGGGSQSTTTVQAIQAPAIVIKAVCGNFSLTLTNNLPFQPVSTCPTPPGEWGTSMFDNGPHDFEWTNMHTHGLKVDPGAVTLWNVCEPGNPVAGFPAATKSASRSAYYCDPNLSSEQLCQVLGDNIYVGGRPHSLGLAPGATLKYTYPLGGSPPGVGWYHPHLHGSGGIQVPTAAGPLIIPESWLPGGLRDLYEPASKTNAAVFDAYDSLMDIMRAQPLESSTILRFDALWFRNRTDGSPDDDSLAFLGSTPGGANVSPLLYDVLPDGTSQPKYSNAAGRDWGLVNGAFQPTITLTDNTYARWQLLNTMTMKWLDLTFQKVLADGSMQPADCSFWLLGRDAVPLPRIPRRLQSKPAGATTAVSDLILAPGNRADVLVKCNAPGTYVLASGAGPFHTNYTACQATHCELFGDVAPASFGLPRSANNLYGGRELDAAVLAVVKADLAADVARTRLERFAYLNHTAFPQPAVEQCFSFMNAAYGGMCSVNNELYPDGPAYVREGSHQVWKLRDITFHPFHLHESPIRLTALPPCATSVTNMWQVGDWVDVLLLPTCQTGCPWEDAGSGGGNCGTPVSVCDQVTAEWVAERFYSSGYTSQSPDLCAAAGFPATKPATSSTCQSRNSIFHCHIIPHSDEGCGKVVKWYCPDDPNLPSPVPLATCPAAYPDCPPPEPPTPL